MRFPQCFLVCELGPAIDQHAYEKSFRGQLYFPMCFFFFFSTRNILYRSVWVGQALSVLKNTENHAPRSHSLHKFVQTLVACIQPNYASCHWYRWLHTLVLKFRLKPRKGGDAANDFSSLKKKKRQKASSFFLKCNNQADFKWWMLFGKLKQAQSTHVYFQYFFVAE